jgi:hypothetical protein
MGVSPRQDAEILQKFLDGYDSWYILNVAGAVERLPVTSISDCDDQALPEHVASENDDAEHQFGLARFCCHALCGRQDAVWSQGLRRRAIG